MLTLNGKALYGIQPCSTAIYGLKTYTGQLSDSSFSKEAIGNNTIGASIVLGSDGREPTVNDYRMYGEWSSEALSKISETKTYVTSYDQNYMLMVQATFKNNSLDNNIEVNEIGLVVGDKNGYYKYLISRDVFDSPIIIRPQATQSFTVTIG